MSDLIKLRGLFGQTEVNCRGVLYAVNKWNCVNVPTEDAPSLMKVGGFHIANEATEGVATSTLADVEDVCWHLPLGKVRSTLLALVTNTNALNYLVQSARPNVTII
jgi:hypothetical protein